MLSRRATSPIVITLLLLGLAAACSKDKSNGAAGSAPGAAASGVEQKDGAEGLKAVFTAAHAACNGKELAKGKAITMSIIPTKAALAKALKDGAPADLSDKILAQYKEQPPSDEVAACVFVPGKGRTEIRVHESSVEDLIAYKQGTPSFEEFPGGAKKLAEQVLRPGMKFYEVEVTEPGKDSGMKYHMFFWDGSQWRMLGPAWRHLGGE